MIYIKNLGLGQIYFSLDILKFCHVASVHIIGTIVLCFNLKQALSNSHKINVLLGSTDGTKGYNDTRERPFLCNQQTWMTKLVLSFSYLASKYYYKKELRFLLSKLFGLGNESTNWSRKIYNTFEFSGEPK